MHFILQGNCWDVELPNEFNVFFENGIPVDRRNGKPMEMEIYYLYHTLRLLEELGEVDVKEKKQALFNALIGRLHGAKDFWYHHHFSTHQEESHMRFTNAAIRLFLDYISIEKQYNLQQKLCKFLNKHLSYNYLFSKEEEWFLHDSLENYPEHYANLRKTNYTKLGGKQNMLVVNTHLDTLVTLGQVLIQQKDQLSLEQRQFYEQKIEAGLRALERIFYISIRKRNKLFHKIDSWIRNWGFKNTSPEKKRYKLNKRLFIAYYWRLRIHLRTFFPSYVFSDGYLERDLRLIGLSFGYHVVNIWDLAKLSRLLSRLAIKQELNKKIQGQIRKSLYYTFESNYYEWMVRKSEEDGTKLGIQICEAMGVMFQTGELLNPQWLSRYLQVRKLIDGHTCGMMGFDPCISEQPSEHLLKHLKSFGLFRQGIDLYAKGPNHCLLVNALLKPVKFSLQLESVFEIVRKIGSTNSDRFSPSELLELRLKE